MKCLRVGIFLGLVSALFVARFCPAECKDPTKEAAVLVGGVGGGPSLTSGLPNVQTLVSLSAYGRGCDHFGLMFEAGSIRQLPGDTWGFGSFSFMNVRPLQDSKRDMVFVTYGGNFIRTLTAGVGVDHKFSMTDPYDGRGIRLEARDYYDISRNDHNFGIRISLISFAKDIP